MNGHSTLIGWYNSGSKRFCYKDEKKTWPDKYTEYMMPVYAVVEERMRKDLQAENERLKNAINEAASILHNIPNIKPKKIDREISAAFNILDRV